MFRFAKLALGFAAAAGAVATSWAQTCGFVGTRTVERYWIETGLGLVIVPHQAFDNAPGCTSVVQAVVPESHALYKQFQASVMMAMATGMPINGYGCGCQSAWGQTYPLLHNIGVGGPPQ